MFCDNCLKHKFQLNFFSFQDLIVLFSDTLIRAVRQEMVTQVNYMLTLYFWLACFLMVSMLVCGYLFLIVKETMRDYEHRVYLQVYIFLLKEEYCYKTIMFGRVTHTLDAGAMQVRSLFASFTSCNISGSCSLIPKENVFISLIAYLVPREGKQAISSSRELQISTIYYGPPKIQISGMHSSVTFSFSLKDQVYHLVKFSVTFKL